MRSIKQPQGYVALITIAVVMSSLIVIGVAITLLIATGLLSTFTYDKGQRAFYIADSCAYEALLQVKRQGTSYIGSHTLDVDGEECSIDVSAGAGTEVDVEVTGNFRDQSYRKIYMEVETNPYALNSWQETQ